MPSQLATQELIFPVINLRPFNLSSSSKVVAKVFAGSISVFCCARQINFLSIYLSIYLFYFRIFASIYLSVI